MNCQNGGNTESLVTVKNSTDFTFKNNIFSNNTTKTNIGNFIVLFHVSSASVSGNIFKNNTTYSPLYSESAGNSSIYLNFTNNKFLNNNSIDGGGILVYDGYNTTISGNLFANNSATNGGAINHNQSITNLKILNNTIVNNTASNNGGGLFLGGSGYPPNLIANNIIWGNEASNGEQIYYKTVPIPHNDFYNNNIESGFSNTYFDLSGGGTAFSGTIPIILIVIHFLYRPLLMLEPLMMPQMQIFPCVYHLV